MDDVIGRRVLKIVTDLNKVRNGDVMGTPRKPHVQFLETRDVRLGKNETSDSQLGDSGREDVLFESGDGPVVDVSDWNEGGLVVSSEDIDSGRVPVIVVHTHHVNGRRTYACMYSIQS